MKGLRFILGRMIRQKKALLAALLMTAAQCLLELWLPRLMAEAVNGIIGGGNTGIIFRTGSRMLTVSAFMGLSGYCAGLLCAYIGQRFSLDLRQETYDKICSLSVQQVSLLGHGSLIVRLTADIDTCSGLAYAMILLVVEPLLLMTGGIIMMWRISHVLGLIFVVFVFVQLLVMAFFIRSTAPLFVRLRAAMDHLNSCMQDAFHHFRFIRAYGITKASKEGFLRDNRVLYDSAFAVQYALAVFNPLIMLIMDLAVACILYFSGLLAASGAINLGLILSAVTYSEQILLSIASGGRMFKIAAEAQPCAERIGELLDMEPDMEDGQKKLDFPFRSLCMQSVRYFRPDGTKVFDSLNFSISAGETAAVIGPVGCGKTTLAGLCARLDDVRGGRILLNGEDIRTWRISDVRRMAAFVEKDTAVCEGTVLENIVFGRNNISEEDIRLAVKAAQLEEFLEKAPEGLDTHLISMGRSLSGGERQRLACARALAGRPGLLILDDSTSSLDYETERRLFRALRMYYPEMAVLFTTNRLQSALGADRILVLDRNGKAAGEGTDASLQEKCGLYRRIRSLQDTEM